MNKEYFVIMLLVALLVASGGWVWMMNQIIREQAAVRADVNELQRQIRAHRDQPSHRDAQAEIAQIKERIEQLHR